MNKDVIYIDVDDDITVISSKLKASKEKIVALVPPKRIGVLQSVVNLRILQRVAKRANKRLVLITNEQSLLPLAAGAGIPVAKNLQSRPEIPDIPALKVDDEDDIIDGSELPVGQHVDAAEPNNQAVASVIASDKLATPPAKGESPGRAKKAQKVPNFNKFRKKLLISGGFIVLLAGFLVWAIWFAPRATVIVSAKTSNQTINTSVSLRSDVETDASKGVLKSIVVTDKKEVSIDFSATGTKEEGKAASGSMTLSKSTPGSKKVPLGTGFSNGDCTFVTQTEVTVPGAQPEWNGSGFSTVAGRADVKVRATTIGDECNLSARRYESTIDGVGARGSEMTGGSRKILKVVTQADVQKASEQLAAQKDDDYQSKLAAKFNNDVRAIKSSFITTRGDVVSEPEVGQEAPEGKAKLKGTVTYSLTGVKESELRQYLEAALESKLSKENNQRIYDAGDKDATFSDFNPVDGGASVSISAKGQVGPQVSDKDIKARTKGKRFGDIQADLKSIQGVDDVEVDFWPFWVNIVPEDDEKINVQFDLKKTGV
ncbi:hypothetical protein GX865_02455 [Candidatus Saccharibacteria bacterium]|jgi:hypothetical protein|nr:hypothetical protein [Candidatus Saccharibacteria bacterium]